MNESKDKSALLASLKIDRNPRNGTRSNNSSASHSASRSYSWFFVCLCLVLLVTAISWSYTVFNNIDNRNKAVSVSTDKDNNTAATEPSLINTLNITADANSQNNSVLEATGYITARIQATISSKVTGRIQQVLVEEGQYVTLGETLATLDDSQQNAVLALVQAELNAEAASIEELKLKVEQAQLNYSRIQLLAERSLASQAELDTSRLITEQAHSRLGHQLKMLKVIEAKLNVGQQQLRDLEIKAPFSGVVIAKSAQMGEMISPISGGGFTRTGICTLVDMNSLEIVVDVNEANIQKIGVGQEVIATLNSYQQWQIPAKVAAIIPTADRNKATVRVRIEILNLDSRMLPDMGVRVAFINPAGENL